MLGRVESRDGIVEGRHGADVRPQPSVSHSLDDLPQLNAIGFNNEINDQRVVALCLQRADDGHDRSSGPDQTRRALADIATDEIEHQVDFTDILQRLIIEIDELMCAEVECLLTVGGTSSADNVSSSLSCELRHY